MTDISNYIIPELYTPTVSTPKIVNLPQGQSATVSFIGMVNAEQGDTYTNKISEETMKLLSPHMRQLIKNADLKLGATNTLTTKSEPEKGLRDIIGEKGLKAYQYDEYIKEMRARIRGDVLNQMGIDDDTLKSLPTEDRIRLERIIDNTVRQRMEDELQEKQRLH